MTQKRAVLHWLQMALNEAGQNCSLSLDDREETVLVKHYNAGYSKEINVNADSPLAMIVDVVSKGFEQ